MGNALYLIDNVDCERYLLVKNFMRSPLLQRTECCISLGDLHDTFTNNYERRKRFST